MQRPQSQVANRLSKMLLLSSIIFFAMAVDGQFIVTRKTEENINYAQTIEYHKITKTALKDTAGWEAGLKEVDRLIGRRSWKFPVAISTISEDRS